MIFWQEWPGPLLKGWGVDRMNQGPLHFPNVIVSWYLKEFAKAVASMVCKEYTYSQGVTTSHYRTLTRYINNGILNDNVVWL